VNLVDPQGLVDSVDSVGPVDLVELVEIVNLVELVDSVAPVATQSTVTPVLVGRPTEILAQSTSGYLTRNRAEPSSPTQRSTDLLGSHQSRRNLARSS
jgi:hypothetical protein